jgi:hypothetical protein
VSRQVYVRIGPRPALERTADAFVARTDSDLAAAIAWSILGAIEREGEVEWVTDAIESAQLNPFLDKVVDHIMVALQGMSRHEAAGVLVQVVGRSLANMTDAGFADFVKLAQARRKAGTKPAPSVN